MRGGGDGIGSVSRNRRGGGGGGGLVEEEEVVVADNGVATMGWTMTYITGFSILNVSG